MTLPFGPPPPNDSIESLQGAIERIVFHNPENGWTVLRLSVSGEREPTTVVGPLAGIQAIVLMGHPLRERPLTNLMRVHRVRSAEEWDQLRPEAVAGLPEKIGP